MGATSNIDEGEILEVDLKESEKASLSQPSVDGSSVDRHSSRRLPKERSPQPRTYSPDPPSSRHEDVSMFNGDYYSDGSKKRRRDNELAQDDTRRHKIHYEGNGARGGGAGRGTRQPDVAIRRARVSYADLDGTDNVEKSVRSIGTEDDGSYPDSKRTRTRSRSPPRGAKGFFAGGNEDYRRGYGRDDMDGDRRRGGGLKTQSVSDRARRDHPSSFDLSEFSRRDAEYKRHEVSSSGQRYASPPMNGRPSSDHRRNGSTSKRQQSPSNGRLRPVEVESDVAVNDPVDEAKLLEERRKRREAIKAKYKGQATPLLVSALKLDPSTPGSPVTDTTPGSPMNVVSESGGASPAEFTIEKSQQPTSTIDVSESALECKAGDDENEPSAADYDPTNDMEEDRMRHDKRHNEVSSSAYDEVKTPKPHDILLPVDTPLEVQPVDEQPNGADKDNFDMFADGDDDDMFAPSSPKLSRVVNPIEAAAQAVAQAKQLDVSMLDNWDDGEGYYRIILGELIDSRYHVQANLGKGMFSGVVRALDTETQIQVAIKVIRNNETMRKAGQKEIDILRKLNASDPEDKKHVVRMVRSFDHKGHLCLVFENLSINLREVLKKFGRDIGINLRAVRAYAQQMFLGLSLMRKCNILHADIKPDNILVNEGRNILKICDLGSASDAAENEITPYLVSRFYRAPEIILGMPYDYAIDMWSVGCTLYELYTGKILFTGRTNNQMLRSIMETQGKFSQKMLKKAQFSPMHFDDMLNFRSVEQDKMTGKDVVKLLNFAKPPRELKSRLLTTASGMSDTEVKELNLFIDLLDRCLHLNPEKRITPSEALKHPFIHRKF